MSLHHHVSQSFALPLPLNQSVICLAPCHQTSQSFDLFSTTASLRHHVSQSFALPPATKPVSHLTCSLPLHHCVTMLVSHLPCPLPPNQSVICLAPCHQTSQSFALPPATKPVSHLTCPVPPHHCVTMPLCHCVIASLRHCATVSPCHCVHCVTASPHHHVTVSLPQIIPTTWV